MTSKVAQLKPVSPAESVEAGSASSIVISPEVVMLSDPSGPTAESIRQLRTRIMAQHVDKGRRVLAVCSPAGGSGCSFVAANLAVAFAQAGIKTLLVNADMRDSGVDELFGEVGEKAGLVQFLGSSTMRLDEVTETEIVNNLWFTPSGAKPDDPQELLSTRRFESFMNISMRQFDLVLVDTPPANNYADAQRIASVAGYAILVCRKNKTYTSDVVEVSRQMMNDGICMVGSVLNDF
jgi:capsular exopolysaccharide synthesis family protein